MRFFSRDPLILSETYYWPSFHSFVIIFLSISFFFFFKKRLLWQPMCLFSLNPLRSSFLITSRIFSPPWLADISKLQSSLDLIFSPYTTSSHSSLSSHFSECSQHSLSHSLVNLEVILASSFAYPISNECCHFYLLNISKSFILFPISTTLVLVQLFVLYHLHYCNWNETVTVQVRSFTYQIFIEHPCRFRFWTKPENKIRKLTLYLLSTLSFSMWDNNQDSLFIQHKPEACLTLSFTNHHTGFTR